MDSLQLARELYSKIDFNKLALVEKLGSYSLDNGNMICTVVFRNDKVEILNCVAKPGTNVAEHIHEQIEHYLLYEGDAVVTVNGVKTCLQTSFSPHTPPLTPHSMTSKNGCRFMIARIPPTKGVY